MFSCIEGCIERVRYQLQVLSRAEHEPTVLSVFAVFHHDQGILSPSRIDFRQFVFDLSFLDSFVDDF